MKIVTAGKATLINGDCLEILPRISKRVDMIFADLPYGKTNNKWDVVIDFHLLWSAFARVRKLSTPLIFTASNGFEFELHQSNPDEYRYKWVWNKNNSAGFALAKIRPLQVTEDILVFGSKSTPYYPQKEIRGRLRTKGGYGSSSNYGIVPIKSFNNEYFPKSLINISGSSNKGKIHPTQKPVELLEYLIRTYTREEEVVLDPVMGSGTTAIAALNNSRSFIGIEKDPEIFLSAYERILHNEVQRDR